MSISEYHKEVTEVEIFKEETPMEAPEEKDLTWYLPLYKAALRGDWESAKNFLDLNEDAVTAKICKDSKTALHVVVGTGKTIHFVKKLVNLMPTDALAMQDEYGNTALNIAALVGNTEAAIILVKKNRSLLHIRHNNGYLPAHRAALNAHKGTLVYLLACHYKDDIDPRSLAGRYGVALLVSVIDSGFFDVALALVQHYPSLATLKAENDDYALHAIASVPVKSGDYLNEPDEGDIEDPYGSSKVFPQMSGSNLLFRGNCYTSGSS